MATRYQARESVISLLYALDSGNDKIDKFAKDILEDNKIRHEKRAFALELFNGVKDSLEEIDKIILDQLDNRELKDLGIIEKSILRLGTYEMMNKKIDSVIIINESIELAKNLAGDTAPKFINAVMDSVKKYLD